MTISTEQLHAILAAATAATPGPWWHGDGSSESNHGGAYTVLAKVGDWTLSLATCNTNFRGRADNDGRHIAACSPDVVTELVQELLAARDEIARLSVVSVR